MENWLKNKTVLITGASSGIGAATSIEFARAQANLILAARRVDRLEKLKFKLEQEYSVKVFVIGIDITNSKQVTIALNHLPEEFKKIDILINNAGKALGLAPISIGETNDWNEMIDTNIKGFLSILQIITNKMIEQKSGHIINIGSIAGVMSYPNGGVYCGTKAATHAITESLRMELLEYGIKVSEILPGALESEFSLIRFKGNEKEASQVYAGYQPLEPQDVAKVIVYCASCPSHVNLAEMIILPSAQAGTQHIYRKNEERTQ